MKKLILLLLFFSFITTNAQVEDFKNIDFTRADNIAKLNDGESLENLSILSYKLTSKLPTKVEKFRAIYTWVCNNIKGDINQHNKVTKTRVKYKNDSLYLNKWNHEYKKTAFKKLLKYKKTMCTGYAYLIKELAFLADIECEIVDGYGRTVESNVEELEMTNHSWNAVKLNDKWYLCDATWSSGYMDEENSFIKDYNDGYFLTDPTLFAKNHFPILKKWLLNTSTTSTTFTDSPIVYGEAFKHKVIPMTPSTMNIEVKKREEIIFKFETLHKNIEHKISLVHYIGDNEKSFEIYDLKKENGTIQFKNRFKWLGLYDVHLKIDQEIVATYTVKVTRQLDTLENQTVSLNR